MKKKQSCEEYRMQNINAFNRLVEKELKPKLDEIEDKKRKAFHNSLANLNKELVNLAAIRSEAVASFTFKHAVPKMKAMLSHPRFLSHFIDTNVRDWLSEEDMGHIVGHGAVREIMEGALRDDFEQGKYDWGGKKPGAPPGAQRPSRFPNIITWPEYIEFNTSYTLSGVGFGNTEGDLYLTRIDNNQRIDLSVIAWSDTAIRFHTNDPVEGIPFDCIARIHVRRADVLGYSQLTTIITKTSLYLANSVCSRLWQRRC